MLYNGVLCLELNSFFVNAMTFHWGVMAFFNIKTEFRCRSPPSFRFFLLKKLKGWIKNESDKFKRLLPILYTGYVH